MTFKAKRLIATANRQFPPIGRTSFPDFSPQPQQFCHFGLSHVGVVLALLPMS